MNPETTSIVALNAAEIRDSGSFFVFNDGIYTTTNGSVYRPNNSEILDEKPLKHFLMKYFTWIKDVTEVSIRNSFNRTPSVDIHITVSPTHHTELMDDRISRIVCNKLRKKISSLLIAMYPDIKDGNPNFIFFPEHSETILDLL